MPRPNLQPTEKDRRMVRLMAGSGHPRRSASITRLWLTHWHALAPKMANTSHEEPLAARVRRATNRKTDGRRGDGGSTRISVALCAMHRNSPDFRGCRQVADGLPLTSDQGTVLVNKNVTKKEGR
jgi:hypothetical protein